MATGSGRSLTNPRLESGAIEWPDDQRDHGEARVPASGEVDGLVLHVALTDRGDVRRIIGIHPAKAAVVSHR